MKKRFLTLIFTLTVMLMCVCGLSACGDCEHEWGEWSISAPSTCSAQGTKQRKCSKCEEIQSENIDIADHKYDVENIVWTWNGYESATATLSCVTDSTHIRQINANVTDEIATAPTCTVAGTKTYTATVKIDGVTYTATKNETLAALGHTEVKDAAVAATCKQVGLAEGSHCSVCNEVLVAQQELSKTNHTEETLSAVTASCSTEGLTEGKKCSVCNEILVAQVSLRKLPHTETVLNAVAPSCSEEGLTEGKKCSVCNEILVAQNPVDKIAHTEETVVGTAPTCSSTGLSDGKKCSVCKEILAAQTILPKTACDYESVITDPTCEAQGYTTHTCSTCGDSYIDSYKSALGHAWGSWKANAVSTKTIRDCTNNCGEYQEIISVTAECIGDYYRLIGENVSSDDIVLYALINDEEGSIIEIDDFTLENTAMTLDGENKVIVKYYTMTTIASVVAIHDNLPNTTSSTEFTWSFDENNNCYNLTGFTGNSTNVVIPAHINRVPVRNINSRAFEGNQNIVSLTIPASVQSIGEYAFSGCSGIKTLTLNEGLKTINGGAFVGCPITSLVIPNSVTYIGTAYYQQGAFRDCTKLISVTIGDGLKNIPDRAFLNCTALKTLVIGDGVETISEYAFSGCVSLESVTFGTNLLTIGNNVFENCESIVSIDIPVSVQTIGENAFAGCTGLTTLTLNEGLKTINGGAFMGCPIKTLTIPNSVKTLGTAYYERGAFKDCSKLTSITIRDGLKSIPEHSFANCTALKTLIIGDGVESIGTYAFGGCVSLESVIFGTNLLTIGNNVFENCESIVSIDIPGSVQTIGENAFAGCTGLATLTLNEGLKTINGGAFMGCPIKTLVIPDSVKTIGTAYYQRGAFKDCSKLTSITIGDGLKSIPERSFANCTALKTLVIGDAVESIGEYAFGNCTSLNSITFGESLITIGNYSFQNCESLTSIDIPGTVQTIGEGAFIECSALATLKLNEGLKTIYGGAFMGCPIKTLVIPNSVKTLETAYFQKGAFRDCTQLESVTIGSGLQYISDHSFTNCTALKTITIGNAVETIGEGAFANCSALTNVQLGNGLITISNYAFENCTALTTITIPDSVQTIGEHAFKGCALLVNFNIGIGVQRIGAYALQNCSSLKSVAIPANVQVIGAGLFNNCSSLEEVIIEKGVLREVGNDVFNGCSSFDRMYYTGTASDWVLVAVSEDNSYPLNVSPYYYSSSSPSGKGNYWYYNGNGEIRIWNVSETSFKAEEYSEKFANSTFGSSNTSYSSQFLSQLEGDSLFQARILIWEALHIATDSSWESKAISKKDVYKMVIYDLLVGEVDAQVNPLACIEEACDSYAYEYAKFLLGSDSIDIKALKQMNPSQYDYVELVDKYFKGVDGALEIFEMSANLYDALYVCAQYQALSDMDTNFYLVLQEISNDGSLPWDLRNAASECADCYRTATDAMLKKVLIQEFSASTMQVLWNDFKDEAWKIVLGSVFPQVEFVEFTVKGMMFLANMGFNLDACNEAYYQLEAAVGLENALRNVIKNTLPDYLRYNYKDKSEYYMYAIDMYQTSVLLGFDYSNNLLREHSKSADVNAEEKQAYENMMAQISGMKQEKATMYNNFESVIEQLYVVYYS